MIIAVLGQKGGVGKSTLARGIAVEFARNDWRVLIADMDPGQHTAQHWLEDRVEAGHTPLVEARRFPNVRAVNGVTDDFDLVVIDGAPAASKNTRDAAEVAGLVVMPVGTTKDDLVPQLTLAHELDQTGIDMNQVMFVVNRVAGSVREVFSAHATISEWGYRVAPGFIPFLTSYGLAQDKGLAITETQWGGPREKAEKIIQKIADRAVEVTS